MTRSDWTGGSRSRSRSTGRSRRPTPRSAGPLRACRSTWPVASPTASSTRPTTRACRRSSTRRRGPEAGQGDLQARGRVPRSARRHRVRHLDGRPEGYSLTHAKSAIEGCQSGERRPPHGRRDRCCWTASVADILHAHADRHSPDDPGGARRARRHEAHRLGPRRGGWLGGQRQVRGRRDGRAPPRPGPVWSSRRSSGWLCFFLRLMR